MYRAGIFETFRLLAGIPNKSNLKKYTASKTEVAAKNAETEALNQPNRPKYGLNLIDTKN